MSDRRPIPAATKLARDAAAKGLTVVERRSSDDLFLVVSVLDKATQRSIVADWWDTPSIREFNYAETLEFVDGKLKSRRAPSLKAAREHVGL